MADIELVIKMPEETYQDVVKNGFIYDEDSEVISHAIINGTPLPKIKFTNPEWIDFLCEQFEISRTSAKEMLHVMMSVKREDNFKKQFSGRK